MKYICITACLVLISSFAMAQTDTAAKKATADTTHHKSNTLTIGNGGIKYSRYDTKDTATHKEKAFDVQVGMLDIGFNSLQDNTNYNSAAAQHFLGQVSSDQRNGNLFNLRQGKSINVNIYPVMFKYRLLKTNGQKIYLSTGLGLQMYNFRFEKPISFINNTEPAVITDTVSFSKNKLGLTYLTMPLMLTFKTRITEKNWLVYGVGITGGYRLASWTKQKSAERGKDKNHDSFNFSDFNACITGEIGVQNILRLYASYQLTNMYKNSLDQHPFSIGIRFFGL
ncbi:outer membrane beta-barrel protein [Chitinophagaceae bacterium MMS25-I14]